MQQLTGQRHARAEASDGMHDKSGLLKRIEASKRRILNGHEDKNKQVDGDVLFGVGRY